jgi:hypothetical protein
MEGMRIDARVASTDSTLTLCHDPLSPRNERPLSRKLTGRSGSQRLIRRSRKLTFICFAPPTSAKRSEAAVRWRDDEWQRPNCLTEHPAVFGQEDAAEIQPIEELELDLFDRTRAVAAATVGKTPDDLELNSLHMSY